MLGRLSREPHLLGAWLLFAFGYWVGYRWLEVIGIVQYLLLFLVEPLLFVLVLKKVIVIFLELFFVEDFALSSHRRSNNFNPKVICDITLNANWSIEVRLDV